MEKSKALPKSLKAQKLTFLSPFSVDGTTPGVSSLQSVMAASQTSNRLNLLTPSLAKFFRPDLISHVTNWPAEILEKQVKFSHDNRDDLRSRLGHFQSLPLFSVADSGKNWNCSSLGC